MIRKIILAMLLVGISISSQAELTQKGGELKDAQVLIQAFNALPNHVLFCSQPDFEAIDFDKLRPNLQPFFSTAFSKLFAWAHCEDAKPPRKSVSYYWDFRNGLSRSESNYGDEIRVKNVKVLPATLLSGNRASVKTTYNFYMAGKTTLLTTYTLIFENGTWKIDDIALKGFVLNKGTEAEETVLPVSKSLKTELKADYDEAEQKYIQDKAGKTPTSN